jgi:FkbM family methyltransferase
LHKFFKFLYSFKFPIFKRLIPSLIKRIFFSNKTQIIELSFGKIKLDLNQAIDREIYLNGFYEKEQLFFLDEMCNKHEITHFFDIGANIGYYSLYFKKIKNIFAFEPNKRSFLKLKENNKLNNLNIKMYNFGLSNSNSESEIWYTNIDKIGGSAIYEKNDPELKKYNSKNIIKDKISIKKLDDILNINNSKILIKIDVERHEKKVLEGMNKIIHQNKVIMQIEISDEYKKEVFDYLNKLNFKWINTIRHDHYFIKDL